MQCLYNTRKYEKCILLFCILQFSVKIVTHFDCENLKKHIYINVIPVNIGQNVSLNPYENVIEAFYFSPYLFNNKGFLLLSRCWERDKENIISKRYNNSDLKKPAAHFMALVVGVSQR